MYVVSFCSCFLLPYIIESKQKMIAETCSNIILTCKPFAFESICVCVLHFILGIDKVRSFLMFAWDIQWIYEYCLNVAMLLVFLVQKDQIWEYYHLFYYLLHTFSVAAMTAFLVERKTHIYTFGIYADVAKQFSEMNGKWAHNTHAHYFAFMYTNDENGVVRMRKWYTLSNHHYHASGSHKWI